MTHPERVEDYLEHIAQAIARATGYLQHTENLAAFAEAPLYQDAVLRNMEIIGEAATKIHKAAPDFTARHPEIPWVKMREMRNLLIHEYFFVNLEIVWSTVKNDLPPLQEQIQAVLIQRRQEQEEQNQEQGKGMSR